MFNFFTLKPTVQKVQTAIPEVDFSYAEVPSTSIEHARRLARIETRLVRLMLHMGLDANGHPVEAPQPRAAQDALTSNESGVKGNAA